MKLDYLN